MGPGGTDGKQVLGGATADVLVFGAGSMVGSDFVDRTRHRVAAAGRVEPKSPSRSVERFDVVDFLDPDSVRQYVRRAQEAVIVNFAARTDVDGIERERPPAGATDSGPAWVVNGQAPGAIAKAAREGAKRLIQISTDFVFDGREGPYAEDAPRSPLSSSLSWYGWTKSLGERFIEDALPGSTIVRIAYPYRAGFPSKLDFARWMMNARKLGKLPPLYRNQQITPTWVPDVSRVVEHLIEKPHPGVFHVASPTVTTPLEFGEELVRQVEGVSLELPSEEMTSSSRDPSRAPRPIQGGLRSERLRELGVSATPWRDGLRELVLAEARTP